MSYECRQARNACGKVSTGTIRSPSAPRPFRGCSPQPDEEGLPFCFARADRLLLDAADRADGAVREDLTGRRHLVAVNDVVSEFLQHLEREREARRRAADVPCIDADGEGMDVERRLQEEPTIAGCGCRSRPTSASVRRGLLAAPDGHGDRLADLAGCHDGGEVYLRSAHPLAVDVDDHVVRLELAVGRHARRPPESI